MNINLTEDEDKTMYLRTICILAILAFSMTACISAKSYVDPQYHQAKYEDIKTVIKKHNAIVEVEFQRNGERFPQADNELRQHVEIVLRATGVILPNAQNGDFTIKVTANNIADLADTRAKGFTTGLTFGTAGSTVTDYYEFTIALKNSNGEVVTKKYNHAIHTTIGNKSAPISNIEPTTPASAFGKIVEDVILNFIKEMQAQNIFTLNNYRSLLITNTRIEQLPIKYEIIMFNVNDNSTKKEEQL